MPATYVTEAELRSALGIGALYSSAVVEECCQAAEDIVKSITRNSIPVGPPACVAITRKHLSGKMNSVTEAILPEVAVRNVIGPRII